MGCVGALKGSSAQLWLSPYVPTVIDQPDRVTASIVCKRRPRLHLIDLGVEQLIVYHDLVNLAL